MYEHYCPFCRRELLTEFHADWCEPGQTFGGALQQLGLRANEVGRVIGTEARQSLPGRFLLWITERIYGPLVR